MKTRMQPIGNAWQKLPRIVRDLCAELGKDIELDMRGADTELDRQVLDLVKDPLTHLVRNCADHGIESPAERIAAGKPAKGTIRLAAWHEGGHIIIEISDNGRGLEHRRHQGQGDREGRWPARRSSPPSPKRKSAITFSRRASRRRRQVTSISGRGVGMDVVRNNIEQIGGTVDLKSVAGAGTTFTIKIPLTFAIVSALIVESAGERFAIPQLAVLELVRAGNNGEHRIERIKDAPVLRLRNKLLPLVPLKEVLRLGECDNANGFVVVTQVGSQVFGVVVDGVFHTEEIVIKPMSSKLRHIPVFSGTTILGDGSVIMIIDPNGVAQSLGRAAAAAARAANAELAKPRGRQRRGYRLAAGVPRRLAAAEGGAAVARHAARGDRLPQDRNLRRPASGAIPRSADAAAAHRRRDRAQERRRAAGPGVLRPRPLHGPRRRRDRRHRRGEARHRSGERPAGPARLCGDQGRHHRDHRRRPFPAAGVRGLVPPPRSCDDAARAHCAAGRRLAVLPRTADAVDQGRRLSRGRGGVGRRRARGAQIRHPLRSHRHRHRHAGHGRLRARRSGARHAGAPPKCRSSRSPPWCPPTPSSAAARSASTISSPSSTAPAWSRRSRSRAPN